MTCEKHENWHAHCQQCCGEEISALRDELDTLRDQVVDLSEEIEHRRARMDWIARAAGREFIRMMSPDEPFGAADWSRFEYCIKLAQEGKVKP